MSANEVRYITYKDAPNWRVRIHVMREPDFVYVTLQHATPGNLWLDSFMFSQKFPGDQLFEALCYANDLIRNHIPLQEQAGWPPYTGLSGL